MGHVSFSTLYTQDIACLSCLSSANLKPVKMVILILRNGTVDGSEIRLTS